MCNSLHQDSKPIKEEGKGWKIFGISHGRPLSFIKRSRYHTDDDGWVKWIDDGKGDGFCFFRSKRTGLRVIKLFFGNLILLPIIYRKGKGWHIEHNMSYNNKIPIALCGEFKLDPSVEDHTKERKRFRL